MVILSDWASLGNWKSPVMVSRYAHLADETLRGAAKQLDQLVEGVDSDPEPDDSCAEPVVLYLAAAS